MGACARKSDVPPGVIVHPDLIFPQKYTKIRPGYSKPPEGTPRGHRKAGAHSIQISTDLGKISAANSTPQLPQPNPQLFCYNSFPWATGLTSRGPGGNSLANLHPFFLLPSQAKTAFSSKNDVSHQRGFNKMTSNSSFCNPSQAKPAFSSKNDVSHRRGLTK